MNHVEWEYLRSRVVCDKCSTEQSFKEASPDGVIAPCEGPLGMECDSVTGVFLNTLPMYLPTEGAWYIPDTNKEKFMDPYDSRPDTRAHIVRVRYYISQVNNKLRTRGEVHDRSKLLPPEVDAFNKATPLLQKSEYGTPEYTAALAELGPALEHHFQENSHHPEHWPNGVKDMSLLDIIEMLCDWKAASERARKPTPAAPGHPEAPAYTEDFENSIRLNKDRWDFSDELCEILVNTARELGYIE